MQSCLQFIHRKPSLAIPALLSMVSLTFSAPAFTDNYLDSLEAEADTTTVIEQAKKEQEKLKRLTTPAPAKSPQEAIIKETKKTTTDNTSPTGIDVVDEKATIAFEEGLYQEFPGNYAVYTGLSSEDKKKVVAAYQQATNKKGLLRYGPSLSLILGIASQ